MDRMLTSGATPKILVACEPTVGGAAIACLELLRYARRTDVDVTLATPEGWLFDTARAAGVKCVALPMERRVTRKSLAGFSRWRELVVEHDVVHLHSSVAGVYGRAALLTLWPSRRPRCLFTPHGWSWLSGSGLAVRTRVLIEKLLSRVTDAIIAVSLEEADDGRSRLGGRIAHRLVVIRNGVDLNRFSPNPPPERLDPSRRVTIVCVGRFDYAKGQDLLVRALSLIDSPLLDLRLIGDGPMRRDLDELTRELQLAGRVDIRGWSADVATEYSQADVVAVPSRWDAQSLVLLEALASAVPVLATPVPGTSHLAAALWLTEDSTPTAIAAGLERLFGNWHDAAKKASQGRRLIERFHDASSTYEQNVGLWLADL